MKLEDEYNYLEDIFWIILVALLIIFIGYYVYYIYNTYINKENKYLLSPDNKLGINNNINNGGNEIYSNTFKTSTNNVLSSKAINVNTNDIAPPKLVNLYEEDYKVIRNKNDIECTNKDSILLYDKYYKTDNESFDVELIRPYLENNVFDKELDELYTTKLSSHNTKEGETEQIYNYSLKPQKSDLPIANIPIYALLDNKPLKLSEREEKYI